MKWVKVVKGTKWTSFSAYGPVTIRQKGPFKYSFVLTVIVPSVIAALVLVLIVHTWACWWVVPLVQLWQWERIPDDGGWEDLGKDDSAYDGIS